MRTVYFEFAPGQITGVTLVHWQMVEYMYWRSLGSIGIGAVVQSEFLTERFTPHGLGSKRYILDPEVTLYPTYEDCQARTNKINPPTVEEYEKLLRRREYYRARKSLRKGYRPRRQPKALLLETLELPEPPAEPEEDDEFNEQNAEAAAPTIPVDDAAEQIALCV
jgi:hypothetical protein